MLQRITQKRIVPVAVIERPEDAVAVAEALLAGGLDVLEITLRTSQAEQCLRRVRQRFPAMLLGAGTILSVEQVKRCADIGVQFGVSPGLNEEVVQSAQAVDLPFVPGVMTPTEIEQAQRLGCRVLKLFPAEAVGGTQMLQWLAGPYAQTGLKFIASGGIHLGNAGAYLALPIVAAVVSTWVVDRQLIESRQWEKITMLAKEAVEMAVVK